jgi:hypothetical protein
MSAAKKAPAAPESTEAAPKKKGLGKVSIIGIIVGVIAIEWAVAFLYLPSAAAPAVAHEGEHAGEKKHAKPSDSGSDDAGEENGDEDVFGEDKPAEVAKEEGHAKKEEAKKEEHGKKEEGKKEEKGKKEEGKKEEAPKHHARELGPTELEEFELGEFMVSIPHSAASSTSIVTFKLYGTIQHKNLDYVTDHFEQVKNRLHDSIETIIRSSETEDLSHPGLDLIKRKIFETTNKTLGTKPVLKGVIFNGYMYYDQ